MALAYLFTPAPRRGDDPAPALRDTERLLQAAEAVLESRVHSDPPCSGSPDCRRPGTLSVVTSDSSVRLCGLHAMTAVFTKPGVLALVRPED